MTSPVRLFQQKVRRQRRAYKAMSKKSAFSRRAAAVILVLSALLALETPVHAAQNDDSERRIVAKCRVQLRKCNSHCNLVYESKQANRVCRDRCKDTQYVCKAQPR